MFFAILVPLLPLIRRDPDLHLSFTEAALLKSVYAGASAVLQIPAGFMAERVGEFWLLIGGNIWVAGGLLAMAAATGYWLLVAAAVVGGLGGGTQHPLATSMVSRAYEKRGRSTAVGTVNFAGDLGKMAAPAFALLVAVKYGWRSTLAVVALAAIGFMAVAAFFRRAVDIGPPAAEDADGRLNDRRSVRLAGFVTLSGVGFLDSGVRGAALAFLPFLMEQKGMTEPQMFGMLILLLAGGAAGKFVCGWLGERIGTIRVILGTKGLTSLLIFATLPTPPVALAPLVVVLGIGLNGTSSVLYATVASFVAPHRRARMYGYFYTSNEGGGVLMPLLMGRIADLASLRAAIVFLGVVTALIVPASLSLARFPEVGRPGRPPQDSPTRPSG